MKRDRNPSWRRIKSSPFHRIGDTYSHFFNTDHFMGRSAFDGPWLTPEIPANLKSRDTNYEIELALPGFNKNEVKIEVAGDMLIVKAVKEKNDKNQFLQKEINFDSLQRKFQLDADVDRDRIEAKYEDGILKIHLPHDGKKHSIKPKTVKVI